MYLLFGACKWWIWGVIKCIHPCISSRPSPESTTQSISSGGGLLDSPQGRALSLSGTATVPLLDALDRRWRPSINQNLCSPAAYDPIHFDEVRKRKPEVHLVMISFSPADPPSPASVHAGHACLASYSSGTSGDLWCESESLMRFQFTSFRARSDGLATQNYHPMGTLI